MSHECSRPRKDRVTIGCGLRLQSRADERRRRMKPVLACGLLVAGMLSVLGAAGQQPPVFRGGSDVVRVFVTVTDRDGRLVTTLTQENLQIRDEGQPQPITLF